jgi:GNAT superfamily N-acetyltransferase
VHVDSWRTTYAGLIPDDFLTGLDYGAQERRWAGILAAQGPASFVYVVELEGDVAGFASGGREREGDATYTGELYAIYLLEQHQHLGLGRDLVGAVAARLAETGHQSMLVWVLNENAAARGFYEHLGGVFLRSVRREMAGLQVEEAGYGWLDLDPLRLAAS